MDGFNERDQTITIDDFVEIFVKTVGHWARAWVVPAWFWFHNAFRVDTAVIVSLVFALVVDVAYVLNWLNLRYVSGAGSFKTSAIDPQKDVILITGGSHGLGLYLTAMLADQGHRVASADINEPEFEVPNVEYYKCDVSDFESVQKLGKEINKDLGPVTVLINNAGTLDASTWLVDMRPTQIETIMSTNLLSQFWTLKTFLPHMLEVNRGYIVTVASALGYIGPARASAYSASKAGLIGLHDSITHEIRRNNACIRTLLVTPGQFDSRMFRKVKTPSKMLAPVVSTRDLALAIVNALESGRGGSISMPMYAKLLPLVKILPGGVTDLVRTIFGMDYAMDTYTEQ